MVAISGFIKNAAGEPLTPTRVLLSCELNADDGDVVLPIPTSLDVEDGLVMFDAPAGRATLTVVTAEGEVTVPLVVSAGFDLADAVRIGGMVDGIRGEDLATLAKTVEDAAAEVRNLVAESEARASQAVDAAIKAGLGQVEGEVELARASVEAAGVDASRKVEDALDGAGAALGQLKALDERLIVASEKAGALEALVDIGSQYLDSCEGHAKAAEAFSNAASAAAQAVGRELEDRLEALEDIVAAMGKVSEDGAD